jgi:hypothetical protein
VSVPEEGDAAPARGRGDAGIASACDLHLARCSPLCDALGALDWRRPVTWFHDFGLLPLAGGRQLRLGALPPSGALVQIKALTASLAAPGAGVIASQDFPLAPYVNHDRDAGQAIMLCERDGRFAFVKGPAHAPLSAADRRRLQRVCRAIEAWAVLLCGGAWPGAAPPAAAGRGPALACGDEEQLVVEDGEEEPSGRG